MLVDDHAMMRKGLRMLIEREENFCVVGEAAVARGIMQCQCVEPGNSSIIATKTTTATKATSRTTLQSAFWLSKASQW